MKNFIELTDSNDEKIIINTSGIGFIQRDNNGDPRSKTLIFMQNSSNSISIMESYDEVRATIEGAQGIQTVPSGGINIA